MTADEELQSQQMEHYKERLSSYIQLMEFETEEDRLTLAYHKERAAISLRAQVQYQKHIAMNEAEIERTKDLLNKLKDER